MKHQDYNTIQIGGKEGPAMTITLARPNVCNAIDDIMMAELQAAVETAEASPDIRCIILRGSGPVFCSGGDLGHMFRVADNFSNNLDDARKMARLFHSLDQCTKPIIGVVHGTAMGGGLGLLCTCDLVIATADAEFCISEARFGLVPACIAPFLIARVGHSQARRLFLSGLPISSDEALRIGLVHKVEHGDASVEAGVNTWVDAIIQCSPTALKVGKVLFCRLAGSDFEEGILEYTANVLAEMRNAQDGQEGMRAFLEKRKASWQH